MPAKGPGGGSTSFENMTHEQMLAWLDQANSGQVQAAAERLLAAAKAIRDIAEELKIRPQWVAWKGEGADAFRTWTADLANSTLRLGDFSDDAAKWLTEASGAIAQAQASIPREVPGDVKVLQVNVDAARAAHNDPDAATAATQAERELQALTSRKEEARLQAAAQMRKLGQTYSWSAMQMSALERPKFPPPPDAITPDPTPRFDREGNDTARPGGVVPAHASAVAAAARASQPTDQPSSASPFRVPEASSAPTAPSHTPREFQPPARMDIDSVAIEPSRNPHPSTDRIGSPPVPDQVRRETPLQPGLPPTLGSNKGTSPVQAPGRAATGPTGPVRAVNRTPRQGAPATGPIGPLGPGQAAATGRSPMLPGQGVPPTSPGRIPSGPANGIVGGRPVTPPGGRSQGAIPRGVVVGGENTPVRGPVGPTTGTTNQTGRVAGQPGQTPVRGLPPTNGAIIGGRPLPGNGVVGNNPQQPGRAGSGMPGPNGPASTGGTSPVRGGIVGGATNVARQSEGNGTGRSRASQSASANNGNRRGDLQRSSEGTETRQQHRRRPLPPVID